MRQNLTQVYGQVLYTRVLQHSTWFRYIKWPIADLVTFIKNQP
jgi:hypothetical protein